MLSPGSLLQVQMPAPLDLYLFLGTVLKKPRVQVLIQGFPVPSAGETEVSLIEPSSGKPRFFLSHQVFRSIVQAGNVPITAISFVVHEYHVSPFGDLLSVTLTGEQRCSKFVAVKTAAMKQTSILPFGLQMSPRKRKPPASKCDPSGPSKKKTRKTETASSSTNAASATTCHVPSDLDDIEQELQQYEVAEPAANCPDIGEGDSSASSSSSSSSSSGSGSESDGELADLEDSVEKPFLTPEEQVERREVQLVLRSHADLMERRGETFGRRGLVTDVEESEAEERKVSDSSRPTKTATTKSASTFCNKHLGVVEVGCQTSRRLATCQGCNSKIAVGQVRIAFAFSRSKFASWIHSSCFPSYLMGKRGDVQQAVDFFEENQDSYAANVRAEISKILPQLRAV